MAGCVCCRFAHLAGVTLGEQELEEQLDTCLEAVELDYLLARYLSAPHIFTYCFFLPLGLCSTPSGPLQHDSSCNLPAMASPENILPQVSNKDHAYCQHA